MFQRLMACMLAAILVAAASAQEAGDDQISFSGSLDKLDAKDPSRNQPHKLYTIRMMKGQTYVIDLMSKDFDTYLRLLDAAGGRIAEDDDGGGGLNSRIRFSPQADDNFRIVATTYNGAVGNYVLKITLAK